jgi:hypothetical protein
LQQEEQSAQQAVQVGPVQVELQQDLPQQSVGAAWRV